MEGYQAQIMNTMNSLEVANALLLNSNFAMEVLKHLLNLYSISSLGAEAIGDRNLSRHYMSIAYDTRELYLSIEDMKKEGYVDI